MAEIDTTLPTALQKFLADGGRLEEIRLSSTGRWTHEGLDFENPKIIALFFRSVRRTTGGTWYLQVGRFSYPIVVDQCGYFVRQVDIERRILHLSDDTTERFAATNIRYDGDAGLFAIVKDGEFEARFLKGAYLKLAEALTFDGENYCLDGVPISV